MQNIRRDTLRVIATLLILVAALKAHAQSDTEQQNQQNELDKVAIPQLLPPTPDVNAFMKIGFGTTNMSTGAATANVPLYTIKLKDFTFPISLSYSTQGLRADEWPSRVGMGWALNANGIISRSVHGGPDEFGTRLAPPTGYPDAGNIADDTLSTYYHIVSDGRSGFDTQVDEFNFHVNGQKGSFVLDDDYNPVQTTKGNYKVATWLHRGSNARIDSIKVTTGDGVKYTFKTRETTTSNTIQQFDPYKSFTVTAWFLDRIDLPNGENIVFHYTPISYLVNTGTTEMLVVPEPGTAFWQQPTSSSQYDLVGYNTHYLDSINVSNGTVVDFKYTNLKLTSLDVPGQKHYEFQYESGENGIRFFLTSVADVTGEHPIGYDFEYDRVSEVPQPITCGRDYLGFYSGGSYTPLIPLGLGYDELFDPSEYSRPSTDDAKKGTLIKISYPTGGTEEFIYEGNTTIDEVVRPGQIANVTLDGQGGGSGGSYVPIDYWLHNITVPFTQETFLTVWAADAAADFPADDSPNHVNATATLYDETDPEHPILGPSKNGLGIEQKSYSGNFTLEEGHTYAIKLTVKHYPEIGIVSMDYKNYPEPIKDKINVTTPGVRVKQIRYYDPITQSSHSKYYTYASLDELTLSTGNAIYPSYASSGHTRHYSFNEITGTVAGYVDLNRKIYSTSTARHVYALYNTPIFYNTVIESDDPCFANGGTEYSFYPQDQGSAYSNVKGEGIPMDGGQYPTLTGTVRTKRMFNSNHDLVQTEENEYAQTTGSQEGMPISYIVRKNFEPNGMDAIYPIAYDAAQAYFANYWNRIVKKTVALYGADTTRFIQQTTYLYNHPDNEQPDTIVVNDSKGGKWKKVALYSNTTPSHDTGYTLLNNQNRVSIPIYQAMYHNDEVQQEHLTLYAQFFDGVIEPLKVRVRQSTADTLHDEIIYLAYDKTSHPTHLQRVNDFQIAYLWDSIHHNPIAEVKNATPGQIAFTSFEPNEESTWQLDGTVDTTQYFTGKKSFTGELTTAVKVAGDYVVSFWINDGEPKVNNTSITTAPLATSNGWKLYQKTLTNLQVNSSVAVETAESAYMDEVRLHPVNAEMTSFTYKPFVGVTSKTDVNERVSFYEYDKNDRLILIRDQDYNIIKTFDYHYDQQH